MAKKELIAMLLAGGQGTRLKALTKKIAKPAVPFGGKYRIIDFPLSNCSNSGIDTVGVLTQYEPFILNNHIGIGSPWDLDRTNGGLSILQPYTSSGGGNWYRGTADAIFHNINYIEKFDPEYVLILSGDHIYKMDYNKMLEFHKERDADVSIAVINVSLEEASRFGIMNTDENYKIYEFDEKPKHPKSTLASMGVYLFKWDLLKKYLIDISKLPDSSHDFGKDIIPKMLDNKCNIVAYPFGGYWKDVGTIDSLWEANMDLLNPDNELNLFDRNWKIYSPQNAYPPKYVGKNAKIKNSIIVEGSDILGEVENSIIFGGVFIGENTVVKDSVIMSDSIIGDNVVIKKSILGSSVKINDNCVIGDGNEISVVEDLKVIEKNKIFK